jgi:DNA-binding NarL/FixJ family response regulator
MLDMRMPGMGGVEGVETLRMLHPAVKVVVLSACDDRPTIDAALRAGADAYVVKNAHALDIASVLRQASGGAVFHAPFRTPAAPEPPAAPTGPALTERERTILAAAAAGATTAAISRELWVSEHTVKFHLTNIYRKIGVANRAGAVRYAIERGLAA